jgi:putative inorganic carbon (HCO3(-)) transporter
VFLFPLVYSPINFDGYGLPRLALLRAISLSLGLVWLVKASKTGKLQLITRPVLIPLTAYILTVLLSTSNSVHFPTSVYGNFSRYEGFFTIIDYAFLLFLVANFAGEARSLVRLLRAAVASAALVAILGLYQYIHSGLSVRAFSTFLNPDFLGYYLVLIFPLGMGLILVESDFRFKALWFGASLLSFVCLVVTFTRGAWLGFLASMIFLGLILGTLLWKERRTWVVSLLALLLLSGVAIFYLSQSLSAQEMSLKRRLASVVQFTGGTAQARIELWRSALAMIAQRPLLGWGPDTLSLVYPHYKSPVFIRLEGSDVTPDKTHNEFLQVGATLGVVGLATYLWFLIALFGRGYSVFNNVKSRDLKVVVASVLAAGVGYLVAVQFLFSEISFSPFFWIAMGLTLALGRMEDIPASIPYLDLSVFSRSRRLRWLLLAIGILTVLFVFLNNGRILLADFYAQKARVEAEAVISGRARPEGWAKSQTYYQHSVSLNSGNPIYFLSFGASCLQVGGRLGDEVTIVRAIQNFEKAVALNDRVEEAYLGLGDGHFWMGKIGKDRRHWREAELAYRKVIELDSHRALGYFRLGQLLLEKRQPQESLSYFRKAIEADFRYGGRTLEAANELQRQGRLEEAERVYRKLLKWKPGDSNVANDLAVLLAESGRLDEAVEVWNKAITRDPSNSDLYFNLGMAYEQKGSDDLALDNYQKALSIDSTDQRAREGLERLRGRQP